MPNVSGQLYDPAPHTNVEAEYIAGLTEYENMMLARVNTDFRRAEDFRRVHQQEVAQHIRQYRNARYYEELVEAHEFPMPIAQQLCNQLRASVSDKLFYTGRPCKIVGVEETDEADADAKQAMMDWQDRRLGIKTKAGQGIIDCAVRRQAVAKVDFYTSEKSVWSLEDEKIDDPDSQTEYDQIAGYMPKRTVSRFVKRKVKNYVGATVKMVDPLDLFYGPDKRELDDSFPLMIRSREAKNYFTSKSYFRNTELLEDVAKTTEDEHDKLKTELLDNPEAGRTSDKPFATVEWQGPVLAYPLYKYMLTWVKDEIRRVDIQSKIALIEEGKTQESEMTWAICTAVDKQVVVRLEEMPHGLDRPNIIVGVLECEDSVFRPTSVMDKIYGICREADKAAGQLRENIAQNIDAGWGIDVTGLSNKKPIVNKRGFLVECNRPPRDVMMRIDQPPLVEPLMALMNLYSAMARDAAQIPLVATGAGDPDAETLGEATIVESHARLGISDYLRTFEETFIEPLYEMRNQVNMNLIDQEFGFQVLGEKASDWRIMDPAKVRANVDFVCESSSRETNRAVITQQLLNLLKLAPEVRNAGLPIREDKIVELIAESGYTLTEDQIREILPGIKLEESGQIDIGELVAQASINELLLKAALPLGGGAAGGGALGEQPQPMTAGEAAQSANAENQTDMNPPL